MTQEFRESPIGERNDAPLEEADEQQDGRSSAGGKHFPGEEEVRGVLVHLSGSTVTVKKKPREGGHVNAEQGAGDPRAQRKRNGIKHCKAGSPSGPSHAG